jgi:hypothetical protein
VNNVGKLLSSFGRGQSRRPPPKNRRPPYKQNGNRAYVVLYDDEDDEYEYEEDNLDPAASEVVYKKPKIAKRSLEEDAYNYNYRRHVEHPQPYVKTNFRKRVNRPLSPRKS